MTQVFMIVYNLLLRLVYPTGLCVVLLLLGVLLRKRPRWSRAAFGAGIGVLLVCGNGWVAEALTKSLEWRFLPAAELPPAECIVVCSGGVVPKVLPRPTIELGEEADRVFYAAHLYKAGKAPLVVCTGGIVPGSTRQSPYAQDMAAALEFLGVPGEAIVTEAGSRNTYEHARNLYPLLKQRKVKRLLLVTSALHMPRAFGTFKRGCPDIEIIAAPTDFLITKQPQRWFKEVAAIVPTAANLYLFDKAAHEYIGLAYYKLRGWL
jgi:uncharacterized SAM-binding protein YcdF (DUF218 family)